MVNHEQAPATSDDAGQTYCFCSEQCKRQCEADPQRYTGQRQH